MGDVKRWSVTYTKHIKQKRKVYQDGFLELHNSIHKIMLYDNCEKLIDSRIVKKDDVVRSGETLAFDAYLVDIGDLDGDHKPIPNVNSQGREKKITEKSGLFHGQKFKHNSFPIEWQVLYTTQITQKAKRYHDGILRVAPCGSQGRQVTLYDVSRKLLDSRFLKKHEVIGYGESLAFDGHLVDIGEPEGDHKPLMDLKVQEKNFTAAGKTELSHGQQARRSSFLENGNPGSSDSVSPLNCIKAVKTYMREWDALYTTQTTQKAKKHHSGVLRLASCGSYQMQVIDLLIQLKFCDVLHILFVKEFEHAIVCQATLLDEDKTILSHKYIKLCEDVRSGSTFELPNYVVEVGEPRTSPEEDPPKNAHSQKDVDSNFSTVDVDNLKLSRRVPTDMPLRDANGILSILRKSMTREGSVPLKSASVDLCHASQSSKFIQFDLQNQVDRHLVQDSNCESSAAVNHDEETSNGQKPVAHHDDLTIEIVKSEISDNTGESWPTPSNSCLRSGASVSSPNFDAECTDKSILWPVSSIDKPQVVDVLNMDFSSSCHGDPFSEELKVGTSPQPIEESIGVSTRWREEVISSGLMSSNGCMSHDHSNVESPSSGYKSPSKMDEKPSFDLGF
ncbi:hypothetical protein Acr_15g0001210 [Actinidia rufa]|uniref:5'-3' DNA helicase ZGRF1-like N-terminal domain-containing protein n=1 Tax=Actinidia rufa TaxID=165716 RepID=A0A7J0FS23_9ERIC|nr:hypothetical protein Acr_15g0001210 [Actinidia rufa]